MLAGGFTGIELVPTCPVLPLARGLFGHFRSFPFPFSLRSTAPFLCKMPLLLLGIVGLVAALLEFEEGLIAISI